MRRETLGGRSLILGSAMMLATMALHPTGADIARAPESQGLLNLVVHSLALAALPLLLYGAIALTRRLAVAGAAPELALVSFGLAMVATLLAGTASGFLAPPLIEQAASGQSVARALLHYNGSMNQAFARIDMAASSAAIAIWSVEIVRTRALARGTGIFGLFVGGVVLAALFSGHLTLNVHGMGAVVLLQAAWFVTGGLELVRTSSR